MDTIKNLDSTAIYAYTTLISVLICVPAALIAEGPRLSAGIDAALAKDPNFYTSLFMVGLLYHLYNQARSHPSMCHCRRQAGLWWQMHALHGQVPPDVVLNRDMVMHFACRAESPVLSFCRTWQREPGRVLGHSCWGLR